MITENEAQTYVAGIIASRDKFHQLALDTKKALDAAASRNPTNLEALLTAMIKYNVACTIMSHCLGKLESAYILMGYTTEEAKSLSDDAGYFGLENLK